MARHDAFFNLILDPAQLSFVDGTGIFDVAVSSPACPTDPLTPFVHSSGQIVASTDLQGGSIPVSVIDFSSSSPTAVYGIAAVETDGRSPVIFFEPDFTDGAGGNARHVLRVLGADEGDGIQTGAEIEIAQSGTGATVDVFSVSYNSLGLVSRVAAPVSTSLYNAALSPIPGSVISSVGFRITGSNIAVFVEFSDGSGPYHGLDTVAATVSNSLVEFSGEVILDSGAANWANNSAIRFTFLQGSDLSDEDNWCGAASGETQHTLEYYPPFDSFSQNNNVLSFSPAVAGIDLFQTNNGAIIQANSISESIQTALAATQTAFTDTFDGQEYILSVDGVDAAKIIVSSATPSYATFNMQSPPTNHSTPEEVEQAIIADPTLAGVANFLPLQLVELYNGFTDQSGAFGGGAIAIGDSIGDIVAEVYQAALFIDSL